MTYKLGSLFDGSGGFPLAGSLCGIEPMWAAEVEPYPIAVTRSRFPHMRHLGDISKVNGAEIAPVDVITFGSPCQSNAATEAIRLTHPTAEINPLGDWTGGTDVDTGATNRKLGSDMADSVTGGGLHGKDLSKADVSVNIYAWLKAQETGKPVELCCAIGDDTVDGKPYAEIVEIARKYICSLGGFEMFAEWGLV